MAGRDANIEHMLTQALVTALQRKVKIIFFCSRIND